MSLSNLLGKSTSLTQHGKIFARLSTWSNGIMPRWCFGVCTKITLYYDTLQRVEGDDNAFPPLPAR